MNAYINNDNNINNRKNKLNEKTKANLQKTLLKPRVYPLPHPQHLSR